MNQEVIDSVAKKVAEIIMTPSLDTEDEAVEKVVDLLRVEQLRFPQKMHISDAELGLFARQIIKAVRLQQAG